MLSALGGLAGNTVLRQVGAWALPKVGEWAMAQWNARKAAAAAPAPVRKRRVRRGKKTKRRR